MRTRGVYHLAGTPAGEGMGGACDTHCLERERKASQGDAAHTARARRLDTGGEGDGWRNTSATCELVGAACGGGREEGGLTGVSSVGPLTVELGDMGEKGTPAHCDPIYAVLSWREFVAGDLGEGAGMRRGCRAMRVAPSGPVARPSKDARGASEWACCGPRAGGGLVLSCFEWIGSIARTEQAALRPFRYPPRATARRLAARCVGKSRVEDWKGLRCLNRAREAPKTR